MNVDLARGGLDQPHLVNEVDSQIVWSQLEVFLNYTCVRVNQENKLERCSYLRHIADICLKVINFLSCNLIPKPLSVKEWVATCLKSHAGKFKREDLPRLKIAINKCNSSYFGNPLLIQYEIFNILRINEPEKPLVVSFSRDIIDVATEEYYNSDNCTTCVICMEEFKRDGEDKDRVFTHQKPGLPEHGPVHAACQITWVETRTNEGNEPRCPSCNLEVPLSERVDQLLPPPIACERFKRVLVGVTISLMVAVTVAAVTAMTLSIINFRQSN